jgi:uncharacterized iron-regulated membrane protein
MTARPSRSDVSARTYRMIWRWHFYAGLFCIPFVIWLATTGSIYLFRPQIEALLDRPYANLAAGGPPATAAARVEAALAVVPGSTLHSYQLPRSDRDATQILVGRNGDEFRVYVHPQTLQVLKQVREDDRPMRVLSHLHGELLMGDRGSMVVELAASWAIVLLLTGLYLWWPANVCGLGGVLYPRLHMQGRVFWRDLHAVTALWVSAFALFLLISGMPWAKSWGSMLREVRQWSSTTVAAQDWTTGSSSEAAVRKSMDAAPQVAAEHAGHTHAAMSAEDHSAMDYSAIDRIVHTVQPLDIAPPVLISPPSARSPQWTARSDAANRPLRAEVALDASSGRVLTRTDFAQHPVIDRVVAYGVAAHEGQLFGWLNQALGVFTALGLILLSVSAAKLWYSRRSSGTLGAPAAGGNVRVSMTLVAVIATLSIVLPLLGVSLAAMLLIERTILRRIPRACHFLGLSDARRIG